jgi:long-chain acyl-CoA synthetase
MQKESDMTIRDLLRRSAVEYGDRVALRYKRAGKWQTMTYRELARRAARVGALLRSGGLQSGDRVGLYMDNGPEWAEIYFGIAATGMAAVPVDAKLREQEAAHVLRHSGARVVFAGPRTYAVLREMESLLPDLAQVFLIEADGVLPSDSERAAVRYAAYEAARGALSDPGDPSEEGFFPGEAPGEDDPASIIYTSGTTGRPKGAMLSHGNFCANVESCSQTIAVRPDDHFLLVLPLHHSFAFTSNLLFPVSTGCEISVVESLKTVGENIRELSPTVLIAVPLLLEKMYARILAGLKEKKLVYALFRAGLKAPVRRKIAERLGGKLRLVISGGAPASVEVLRGFSDLGVCILEGYGLTETAPVLTLNPLEAPKPGTVGKPLPSVEIRVDAPNAEGIGELCARGPNVMKGYFLNDDATREVMRAGWFCTGDLGRIDADGYVTITGRKKSLIVNREGKNIYPEEVEAAICQSPFVLECLVLGYSANGETGERVGVIVVPDQEQIDQAADRGGEALSDAGLRERIKAEVRRTTGGLADYKRPRRIQIRGEEFEKTSTSKIKRYLYELSSEEV